MRPIHRCLLSLTILAVACDAPPSPDAEARDYQQPAPEDYAPGCDYKVPIIWNYDYPNTGADCAMKAATCFDESIPDCANGTEEHCLALAEHCMKYLDCYPAALD